MAGFCCRWCAFLRLSEHSAQQSAESMVSPLKEPLPQGLTKVGQAMQRLHLDWLAASPAIPSPPIAGASNCVGQLYPARVNIVFNAHVPNSDDFCVDGDVSSMLSRQPP